MSPFNMSDPEYTLQYMTHHKTVDWTTAPYFLSLGRYYRWVNPGCFPHGSLQHLPLHQMFYDHSVTNAQIYQSVKL